MEEAIVLATVMTDDFIQHSGHMFLNVLTGKACLQNIIKNSLF